MLTKAPLDVMSYSKTLKAMPPIEDFLLLPILLRPVESTCLVFVYSSIYSDPTSVSTTKTSRAKVLDNLHPAESEGQVGQGGGQLHLIPLPIT